MSTETGQVIDQIIKPRGSPGLIVLGPALFLFSLAIPADVSWQIRGTLGLLAWIFVWLVTQCVRLEVTFSLPVLVVSALPLAPWWRVVSVYWDPLVLFILGAVGVAMGWQYWGFTKRIALRSLLVVGTGAKRQLMVWFGLSAGFSAVIADTVVAAMLVPIAAMILAFQGYETTDEIKTSAYPTLVLLAIGWGAAAGGSATPLGGGMDILTIQLLSEYVGYSVPFSRWIYHLLPFTILSVLLIGGYLYFVFDIDATGFEESQAYLERELHDLGAMDWNESVVVGGWLVAFAVVFLHPLYADFLVGPLAAFDPVLIFPVVFLVLFVIPADSDDERMLMNRSVLATFPLPVLFIWPGAIALARILTASGTVELLGTMVEPYLAVSLIGFLVIGVITVLTTNLTTNTAAAAALVPLVIGIAAAAGLPVAVFVYAVGALVNISYALPSSNGCLAVTTGFGANVTTLMRHGAILCLLNMVLAVLYFIVAVRFIPGWTLP